MKNITPINIWKSGEVKTASVLDATIINDNLSTSCTFYWMPKEEGEAGQNLADGNTTMTGDYYDNWDGSNDYAFDYIAKQINVKIL